MGNNEPITSVTTSNGTYTVGMTRTEAEQNGSYKAKIGIDFKDLDTNRDGVLDEREILVGAKNQAKRNMGGDIIGAVCSAAATVSATVGSVFSAGATVGIAAAGVTGVYLNTNNACNDYQRYQEADAQLKKLDEKY